MTPNRMLLNASALPKIQQTV